MNHPELIAVPILMLLDYVLTILGAKTAEVVYRKHIIIQTYELNPIWRKSVAQKRWFNLRHLALVVLITMILLLLDQTTSPQVFEEQSYLFPENTFKLMLGYLFGIFGAICGKHLTNLMLFSYVNRHPDEISGQVYFSLKLILKISQFQYIGLIPLFIFVVALAPNYYTAGLLLGIVSIIFVHYVWVVKAKQQEPQSQEIIVAKLVDTEK